jgi:tetratricopeptide (TPR) repeat protein
MRPRPASHTVHGVVVLALLLGGSATAAADLPSWLDVLEAQGEFSRAWERLEHEVQPAAGDSLAAKPSAEVVQRALRVLLRLGRTSDARALLQRAGTAVEPGARRVLAAVLELRLGFAAAALQDLQSGPPPAGLDGFAHALEAEALDDLERWPEAKRAAELAQAATLPAEMHRRLRVFEARAALALDDRARLRELAPRLGPDAKSDDRTGLLLVELSHRLIDAGDATQATGWLLELLQARPTPAESAFALLQSRGRRGDWTPSPPQQVQLARYEMRSARIGPARARLRALLDTPSLGAEEIGDACLAVAETYRTEGRDRDCLATIRDLGPRSAGTAAEPELLRLRARCLMRLDDEDGAIAVYREIATRFPSHPRADDAIYEVGWRYEIRDDFANAERAYTEAETRFPLEALADDAALRRGLCAFRAGRRQDAYTLFGQMVARYPGSALVPRALYWRLWIQESRGDTTGSAEVVHRLQRDFPTSYYTFLAAGESRDSDGRVQAVAADAVPDPELARRNFARYADAIDALRRSARLRPPAGFDDQVRLWRFFLDYGLGRESLWETRRLETRYAGQAGALLELLAGCSGRGAEERLVRIGFMLGQLLPQPQYVDLIQILRHPAPFTLTLADASRRNGLSPAAILAVMRKESAFEPWVDSPAGARGLMQVMPAVGARLARELGRTQFHPDDLYDPEWNITLGCRLFASEIARAGGRLPQALAAYNAGNEPAEEWWRRLRPGEPPELYLDVAEYLETRTYLEGVLGSLEVYHRVYGLP